MITRNTLFSCFLLLILTACVSDTWESSPTEENKIGVPVTLNLPALLNGNNSRTAEDPLTVADLSLEILVFEKSGNDYLYTYLIDSFSEISDSRFVIQLERTERPVHLMLLAHTENMPARTSWNAGSTTIEEVRSSLVNDLGAGGKWDDELTIPLWGESEDFIVSENNNTLNEIHLLRMFSAIQVTFSEVIAKEEFELTEVRLYNAHTTGLVVPHPSNWDDTEKTVTAPSFPSTPETAPYIVLGKDLTDNSLPAVYVCEAGNTDSTPDRLTVPFLLIGGYYHEEGVVTWYRVDLFSEDENGSRNYRPLLRNRLNQISVTSVGNRGDEDEEEAIGKEKAEMDITLSEWDVTQGNILLYGQNVFTVSRNNIILSKEANDLVQVTVFTDYYSGWTATVDAEYETWLSLVSADENGVVKGEPNVQTSLGFAVKENNTGSPPRRRDRDQSRRTDRFPVTYYPGRE